MTTDSSVPKIVYEPKFKETQLDIFQKYVEKKHKIKFDDYWSFHAWSVEEYPNFWGDVWDFFDVKCSQPYTQVCSSDSTFANVKWFDGLYLNYTENILKYRDSHIAIIATDDNDNAQYITYEELYNEVRVYIEALRGEVKKGDVVCCYMPNKIEAVYAFLATAAIGALWCGALPLLGTKSVLSRFEQVNPTMMFVGGNFLFEGTEIKMDQKIPEIVNKLPSLKKVVYARAKDKTVLEDISAIPKCVYVSEFLENARKRLEGDKSEIAYEQVPFDHPMTLCFTSGTTGAPKGLIHNNGIILASLRNYGIHQDITRKDVIINYSPVGWVTWDMLVATLHLGSTLCLYEGFPFKDQRFYDVIDRYNITTSFIWSSTVEEFEKFNQLPGPHHSLKSLKQLYPMGSVTKPHSVEFLLKKVKSDMFCTSAYGTTEAFGLISGMNYNLPVHFGEIQLPCLGVDLKVVNDKGDVLLGERGDVVFGTPFPNNVMKVLNDLDGEIFKDIYLNIHPGYCITGDDGWINPITRGIVIYGRSDEFLNPKGARFSCSEIYFALEGFPGIMDCVCASHYNSEFEERVVLFLKMNTGHAFTPEVVHNIKKTIEENLSLECVPDLVLEAPDIPYNLTGKKLNGLVKKLINRKPVSNVEIVVNPSSVEYYRTVDLGEF